MSVKATMHWELEQLDLLEKLATRMEWAEDSVQYKKRLKAITREGPPWPLTGPRMEEAVPLKRPR